MRHMILLVDLFLSIIFLVLPFVIGILFQKKTTKSNKTVVLKSIGNVIIMTALQLLMVAGFIWIIKITDPVNSQGAEVLFGIYLFMIFPFATAANIITVVITHFLAKKNA